MARKFQFSLGGTRQRLFTRNEGTKHEDRVWLIEHLKRADIVIEVPDDDADFDLEKLRKTRTRNGKITIGYEKIMSPRLLMLIATTRKFALTTKRF
tara:strand:+ start:228 stop:515 length:288 start_codon:yes stop_codon:yes gene_type:complete